MALTTSDDVNPNKPQGKVVQEESVAAEPKQADQKTVSGDNKKVTINLITQFVTNRAESEGGPLVHGPGEVTVEKELADDLLRRQAEYLRGESDRLREPIHINTNVGNIG